MSESEQRTVRWCAWCGENLNTSDARRRFCNPWHAGQYHRDGYKQSLVLRFEAGEELTAAQFSLIKHFYDPKRPGRNPATRFWGGKYA